MPISSGALEWPTTYYSKRERDEGREVIEGGLETLKGAGNTPRGTAPHSYEWQPQLTKREDYEKWRKKMDKKDPLKTRSKRKSRCCGCLTPNKINKENEDPTNGEQRESPREIIRHHRLCRCCLLALLISVITFILMCVFIFVFLRFTGHEVIGPEDLVECTGKWRLHYLAYAQHASNGSVTYYCCYLPDMNNITVSQVLSKSGWPDGYIVPNQSDCPPPSKKKCEDYMESDFTKLGIPATPCRSSVHGGDYIRITMLLVLVALVVGWLF